MLMSVVLAAGKGTRMVSEQPKVLHPLLGMPLLEHMRQPLAVAREHAVGVAKLLCDVVGVVGAVRQRQVADHAVEQHGERGGAGHDR